MKKLSIKNFTLLILLLLFTSGGYIFYKFFEDSKNITASLSEENIQVNLLNIKYFLDKNLKRNNINQLTAYLDNIVHSNTIIDDIHIIDNNKKLLYFTDRDSSVFHKDITCIPISKIIDSDIFQQQCYNFSIKIFDGFTPYYYTSNVYLIN